MEINDQLHIICDEYSLLVNQAERILFPSYHQGIFSLRNKTGWSGTRRIIYSIAKPFDFLDEGWGLWRILELLLWLALSSGCINLARRFAFNLPLPIEWRCLPLAVLVAVFILFCYWSWIEIFLDQRYKWSIKLLIVLLFMPLIFSTATFYSDTSVVFVSLLSTPLLFFLLILPAITFYFMVLINLLILITWFFQLLLRWTVALHNSLSFKNIEDLNETSFSPKQPNKLPWKLANLDPLDLSTIKKWAEANLNATEKKTIPSTLTLAAIGLLAGTSYISDTLGNFINFILPLQIGAPLSFSKILILFVMGILGIVLIILFGRMFKNIAIQSLIIESCIVAQYAGEKANEQSLKKSRARGLTFWDFLGKWLHLP
jgi:hypothetical protein